MMAINHAVTGALIGLAVGNPTIALPLAFVSHFALDAIPHYDAPGTASERVISNRLIYEQILAGGVLCFLLVVLLASTRPSHWITAAFSAFAAASPDLLWIPRWLEARRLGHDPVLKNWFYKFHHGIQWKTGPKLIAVEAVWLVIFGGILVAAL